MSLRSKCFAFMLAMAGSMSAQTITQLLADSEGDNGNNGQSFLPSDSGITTGTAGLDTFTFFKSVSAVAPGTRFLHIVTGFSGGVETGFVGSSTNSVDWTSASVHNPLVFNFSSLALNPDTTYYAVLSTSSSQGSVAGAGMQFNNGGSTYANGDLLHLGDPYTSGDARFIATFTSIPEPSAWASLAGVSVIGAALLRRRKRA